MMKPMSNEYQNNHYVPKWYQKRFVPVGQKDQKLFYLDFQPGFLVDSKGAAHPKPAVRRMTVAMRKSRWRLTPVDRGGDTEQNARMAERNSSQVQSVPFQPILLLFGADSALTIMMPTNNRQTVRSRI